MASAIGGVPASNFQGTSFHSAASRSTRTTMLPPPMTGGIASSSSRLRVEDADTRRAEQLVPGEGDEIGPQPGHVEAGWGRLWAASISTRAPRDFASSMIRPSGGIVPVTFDIPVTATRRTRSVIAASSDVEVEPAVVGELDEPEHDASTPGQHLPGHEVGMVLELAERRSRRRPGGAVCPQLCATRLIASVVPRVKTIWPESATPRNRAIFSRAPSKASVARSLRVCRPRWTLAGYSAR